jgi:hypothetical protein
MSNNKSQQSAASKQTITNHIRQVIWMAVVGVASLSLLVGCSRSAPLVGEWRGEIVDRTIMLTFFSDGTGDYQEQGLPTKSLSWKPVGEEYEINTGTFVCRGTIRENGSLALRKTGDPDQGMLVLKKNPPR